MLVDLHMHSTASDGVKNPLDLRAEYKAAGIKIMALTDHDTIEGLLTLLEAPDPDIKVIVGCEFTASYKGKTVHILGYDFDCTNKELNDYIAFYKKERETRIGKMIDLLRAGGYNVSMERLKELNPDVASVGRGVLANLLKEAGCLAPNEDPYETVLHESSPYYLPKFKSAPIDIINLIHAANGLAILAHPKIIKNDEYVKELLELPFDGVEIYYSKNTDEETAKYHKMATERKLLMTGGSDYHGRHGKSDDKKKPPLGVGEFKIQSENIAEFLKVIETR